MSTLKRNEFNITRNRILKIILAFALFLSYLIYNLYFLQFKSYSLYKEKVFDQVTTSSKMKAKRGNIYDSNMNILATDKTVWRIFVSPKEIKTRSKKDNKEYSDIIADALSEILSLKKDKITEKISNSKILDVTIKSNASEDEYNKIIEFIDKNDLDDMLMTEAQTSRYYPEGTSAAHLLGFVGSDLQGLYGLEYSYNKQLSGTDGYYLYAKDANGFPLPSDYSTYVEPTAGNSLITTIDLFLQKELESQLETIRINHSVQNRVTGIVMDTDTGAILAMATSSPFDPNDPYTLDDESMIKLNSSGFSIDSTEYKNYKKELLEEMWSNKAVSETYEPGSTFKIVTVSAALDSGVASVNDTFSCHGYLTVGGWHIRCHKAKGHGSGFNLAYGLQMSCNPTMMTIAERLGAEKFYEYVESFGYFEKTGIDLPSEAGTIFHKLENIGTTELATASFGQRFKVSVIRQLTSIASIANGGKLVTPYVVQKIIDNNGNIVLNREVNEVRQVVTLDVANTVATILEEGVSGDGGAKNAAVDGYKVAAKTGTSQKFDVLDANGNSYLRIGSTVAFSLSDDGGIAMIIVVDEPTSSVKYGSVVAAPYISSYLSVALPYLNYESNSPKTHIEISDYVGKSLSEVKKSLTSAGILYEIIGNGSTVLRQTPEKGSIFIYENSKVILYTEEDNALYTRVPDVNGLDVAEAAKILLASNLNLKIKNLKIGNGEAKVISQSISPNSVVDINTVVELEILYCDFED